MRKKFLQPVAYNRKLRTDPPGPPPVVPPGPPPDPPPDPPDPSDPYVPPWDPSSPEYVPPGNLPGWEPGPGPAFVVTIPPGTDGDIGIGFNPDTGEVVAGGSGFNSGVGMTGGSGSEKLFGEAFTGSGLSYGVTQYPLWYTDSSGIPTEPRLYMSAGYVPEPDTVGTFDKTFTKWSFILYPGTYQWTWGGDGVARLGWNPMNGANQYPARYGHSNRLPTDPADQQAHFPDPEDSSLIIGKVDGVAETFTVTFPRINPCYEYKVYARETRGTSWLKILQSQETMGPNGEKFFGVQTTIDPLSLEPTNIEIFYLMKQKPECAEEGING